MPDRPRGMPADIDLSPSPTPIDDVAHYAYTAGFRGKALQIAIAVSYAESTHDGYVFDAHAVGDVDLTEPGEMSVGLWQINYRPSRDGRYPKTSSTRDPVANLDPQKNARHAYAISSGGSNFGPWTTYTNGAYRAHMTSAGWAVDRLKHHEHATEEGDVPDSPDSSVPIAAPGQPILAVKRYHGPVLPIRLGGKALVGDLGNRVVGGRISLTTSEVSQLSLELEDRDLNITNRHQVTVGTQLDYRHHRFEIVTVGIKQGPATPHLELGAQPPGVVRMREKSPKAAKNLSPTDYLARIAKDVGLAFRGQRSAKQETIGPTLVQTPSEPQPSRLETAWEVARRLADTLGWSLFEAGGTLFFGSEPWLVENGRTVYVSVLNRLLAGIKADRAVHAIGIPSVRASKVAHPKAARAYFTSIAVDDLQLAREDGERVLPGSNLLIAGTGVFDGGGVIITSVSWSLSDLNAPATISARTRELPVPKQVPGASTTTTDDTGDDTQGNGGVQTKPHQGSKSALDFVTYCLQQVGDAYVWGAHPPASSGDPDAFDCSGLVGWAAGQVGVTFTGSSGMQYAAAEKAGTLISVEKAARTRGAVLFRGYRGSEHVVVSLGDGEHTVEARGRAYGVVKGPIAGREWDSAALVPGMRY